MKYEIYQLKEDTMEQTKLRFMASDQRSEEHTSELQSH